MATVHPDSSRLDLGLDVVATFAFRGRLTVYNSFVPSKLVAIYWHLPLRLV